MWTRFRELIKEGTKKIVPGGTVTIVEFDDEILMRFNKGGPDEHKHEAGESSEEIEGDRQGDQKIRKIKSGGKSPESV